MASGAGAQPDPSWWARHRKQTLWTAGLALLVLAPLVVYVVSASLASNALEHRIQSGDLGNDLRPYSVHYRFQNLYAGTQEGDATVDPGSGLVLWMVGTTAVETDTRNGLEYWIAPGGAANVYRDYSPSAPMAQAAGRDVHFGFVLCPPQWSLCGQGFSAHAGHGEVTGRLDTDGRVTDLHVADTRWGQLDFTYSYGSAQSFVAPADASRKGVELQLALARGTSHSSCFILCSQVTDEAASATVTTMRHSVRVEELELQVDGVSCRLDQCDVTWEDNDHDGLFSQGDRIRLKGALPDHVVLHDLWANVDVYTYTAQSSAFPAGMSLLLAMLGAAALRRRTLHT